MRCASAGAGQAAGERRLLRLAAWMMDRSEPFTREDLLEAFADDYRGSAEARHKKFSRDKDALERMGVEYLFGYNGGEPVRDGCWRVRGDASALRAACAGQDAQLPLGDLLRHGHGRWADPALRDRFLQPPPRADLQR